MENLANKVNDASSAAATGDAVAIPVTVRSTPKPVPTVIPASMSASQPQPAPVPVASPAPMPPAAEEAMPNVPKFGELQPKVDAHPLFSGARDPRPKRHGLLRKTLWPVVALLVVAALLYLAIDARLIKANINLPYHFFKQPVATTTPQIQAPVVTSQNAQAVAPDPYAGWQTYCASIGTLCFKYPADWALQNEQNLDEIWSPPQFKGDVHIEHRTNYKIASPGSNSTITLTVQSISTPVGTPDLRMVVAIEQPTTTQFNPSAFLTTSSEVSKLGLKVGANSITLNDLLASQVFTVSGDSADGQLAMMNQTNTQQHPTSGFSSLMDAQNWLASDTAKNGIKVLSSVSYKQ